MLPGIELMQMYEKFWLNSQIFWSVRMNVHVRKNSDFITKSQISHVLWNVSMEGNSF
jgi:hypothetical protein